MATVRATSHVLFEGNSSSFLLYRITSQYHRPEDDASTIEYGGLVQVVNYVHAKTDRILALSEHPQYVAVKS